MSESRTDLRDVLRRWLDFHTKAEGLTPEIIGSKAKFAAWGDDVAERENALVADTIRALADTQPAPSLKERPEPALTDEQIDAIGSSTEWNLYDVVSRSALRRFARAIERAALSHRQGADHE